ncbi:MAG: tetratricopeptide repeat protein [Spirochaetales bacterium]
MIRKGMKAFLLLSILFELLSLTACSEVYVGWFLLSGNRYYAQGKFQEAQLAYLKALEKGVYQEWVHYNLGNVYYALGERDAALQEWEKALSTGDPRLKFNVLFNRGVLALDNRNWEEAEKVFIQVLEMEPSNHPAKVNLEYATREREAESSQSTSFPASPKAEGLDEEGERLLQYIRQKENNRWIASDKLVTDESAEDW